MANTRDNFTKSTTDILAKRVGYLCSNPNCRKLTIGAHENNEKSTSIGIAAHITAASSKGPRYDENLTTEQRIHIDNGIWLCGNCSILIDKDPEKFSVDLLESWKQQAEEETRQKLNGEYRNQVGIPYLEADLIWSNSGRWNKGYSDKNPIEIHDGRPVRIISLKSLIYWKLEWCFSFIIFNNSNYPAYNIEIESIGTKHFSHIDKLEKINNLPPLANIDLKSQYEDFVESDHTVADEILKSKIPLVFNDITIRIKYYDDIRNVHYTYIEFNDGIVTNRKE